VGAGTFANFWPARSSCHRVFYGGTERGSVREGYRKSGQKSRHEGNSAEFSVNSLIVGRRRPSTNSRPIPPAAPVTSATPQSRALAADRERPRHVDRFPARIHPLPEPQPAGGYAGGGWTHPRAAGPERHRLSGDRAMPTVMLNWSLFRSPTGRSPASPRGRSSILRSRSSS